jgi:hypothetical protein
MKLLLWHRGTREGSPEFRELFLQAGLAHLSFSQALFSTSHCFFFQFFFKTTKDVLKDLN